MMPHQQNEPALGRSKTRKRSARPEPKGAPLRQCALTRDKLEQPKMIRFAAGPDGVLVVDVAGKLPGRGVWLTANRDTVDTAIKKGVFSRALKQQVTAPDDLSDQVEAALVARCQGLLGMAKKSGQVILGFDQARASIRKEEPGWVLEAADGSKDGRNKVHFLAKALFETVNTAGALSAAELGMAFGRPHVVHGVLLQGSLADHWAVAYGRLTGFRTAPETSWFSGRDR